MIRQLTSLLLIILVLSVDQAAASGMDFGDASALVIGIFISVIGILACLGHHARKLQANQF